MADNDAPKPSIPPPKKSNFASSKKPAVVVSENGENKELSKEQLENVQEKLETKEQETKFFMNEKDQKVVVTKDQCKQNATVYFKGCENGEYTIDAATKCTKVMIEGCSNTKLVFNGRITTNMIELWKCKSVQVEINTKVLTLQIDLSQQVNIAFNTKQNFQQIVWASTNDLGLSFKNSPDKHTTGLTHKLPEFPDLNEEIDQFITRIIEGKILEERVVRLSNGFPTTQREADEHDAREKRNRERAEEKLKKLVKSVEIKHKTVPKLGRNDVCHCGSGKKYKKCCAAKDGK